MSKIMVENELFPSRISMIKNINNPNPVIKNGCLRNELKLWEARLGTVKVVYKSSVLYWKSSEAI